jgi:hypothetical protein
MATHMEKVPLVMTVWLQLDKSAKSKATASENSFGLTSWTTLG